ncbi:MAG: hypothetical protein OXC44_02365 [Proteobacteria bacterium]|nr:hypothetical protein [Pseudomonadota bacterium]
MTVSRIPIHFESDFALKILRISFKAPTTISTSQVEQWKALWCEELKAWHSPYKALIDISNVTFSDEGVEDSKRSKRVGEKAYGKLAAMLAFFKGFYLKKAAFYGYSFPASSTLSSVSFDNMQDACEYLGIRQKAFRSKEDLSLYEMISVDNHLSDKVMEITFEQAVTFADVESVRVLKKKVMNSLMQWHTEWYMFMDLSRVAMISDSARSELDKMFQFFSGFFMQSVICYGMKVPEEVSVSLQKPFFRSRHKALAHINTLKSHEDKSADENASCLAKSHL